MVKERVQHLVNKTSVKFILGFVVVLLVVLAVTFFVGEYFGAEIAIQSCPPGEIC